MKTQICINQMTFWEWQTSEAKSTGGFLCDSGSWIVSGTNTVTPLSFPQGDLSCDPPVLAHLSLQSVWERLKNDHT